MKDVKRELRAIWCKHMGSPAVALINKMNPVIRGWCNYFRMGVSKEVLKDLAGFIYTRVQRSMRRRHPKGSG
jgi:RNA-directed DNA polymerase